MVNVLSQALKICEKLDDLIRDTESKIRRLEIYGKQAVSTKLEYQELIKLKNKLEDIHHKIITSAFPFVSEAGRKYLIQISLERRIEPILNKLGLENSQTYSIISNVAEYLNESLDYLETSVKIIRGLNDATNGRFTKGVRRLYNMIHVMDATYLRRGDIAGALKYISERIEPEVYKLSTLVNLSKNVSDVIRGRLEEINYIVQFLEDLVEQRTLPSELKQKYALKVLQDYSGMW